MNNNTNKVVNINKSNSLSEQAKTESESLCRRIIGCLLIDNDIWRKVHEAKLHEYFTNYSDSQIFSIVMREIEENNLVDLTTYDKYLNHENTGVNNLDAYLGTLMSDIPSVGMIDGYIRQLKNIQEQLALNNLSTNEPVLINRLPLGDKDLIRLRALNDKYSHTVVAGKHRIISLTSCPIDGDKYNLEPLGEFHNYFLRELKVNGVNLGKAWLQWSGNNLYSGGMGYYPNEDKCPSDVFNVFRGFGCSPVEGDTDKLLSFISEIFCGGDVAAYEYFIKWLAHLFQKPMEKPTVAVLAKSDEGTGKGTLYTLLKRMLGANAHQLNGAFQITGRFQSVIVNKLLIFGDEVDLTSKAVADRAKGIISEPTISIERKGYEPEVMPLYSRFIFAGNHSRLISAGTRERRYLILEPSIKRIGDHDYWRDLYASIKGAGANALLHYLLNLDITGFNPNSVPATRALIAEKLENLKPALMFIHEELNKEGKPFNGVVRIESNKLVGLYKDWHIENVGVTSMASLRSAIGKVFSSFGFDSVMKKVKGERFRVYELPEKEVFKEEFSKSLGHKKSEVF